MNWKKKYNSPSSKDSIQVKILVNIDHELIILYNNEKNNVNNLNKIYININKKSCHG